MTASARQSAVGMPDILPSRFGLYCLRSSTGADSTPRPLNSPERRGCLPEFQRRFATPDAQLAEFGLPTGRSHVRRPKQRVRNNATPSPSRVLLQTPAMPRSGHPRSGTASSFGDRLPTPHREVPRRFGARTSLADVVRPSEGVGTVARW